MTAVPQRIPVVEVRWLFGKPRSSCRVRRCDAVAVAAAAQGAWSTSTMEIAALCEAHSTVRINCDAFDEFSSAHCARSRTPATHVAIIRRRAQPQQQSVTPVLTEPSVPRPRPVKSSPKWETWRR